MKKLDANFSIFAHLTSVTAANYLVKCRSLAMYINAFTLCSTCIGSVILFEDGVYRRQQTVDYDCKAAKKLV